MLKKLFYGEEAQGMTEYILIIALVAVISIVIIKVFGTEIKDFFRQSTTKITTAKTDMATGSEY